MDNPTTWTPWVPPYDPRLADGKIATQDEHGRMIESADCGQSCPGCGLCCEGYRDRVTADYAGVEEPGENLKLGRGGLVPLESGVLYRAPTCGPSCPGFERCCQPYELRNGPDTVDDARRVLFDGASPRWAMQQALLTLAHEGSAEAVQVLEAYMPRAHTRLEGFAECALDEGRYMASVPHNEEERRVMMMREVRDRWQERAVEAFGKIEELRDELERLRYEAEVAERLLGRAEGEEARARWQDEVDAMHDMICLTEHDLAEQEQEEALCDAMIDEIEAELGEGGPAELRGSDDDEPF